MVSQQRLPCSGDKASRNTGRCHFPKWSVRPAPRRRAIAWRGIGSPVFCPLHCRPGQTFQKRQPPVPPLRQTIAMWSASWAPARAAGMGRPGNNRSAPIDSGYSQGATLGRAAKGTFMAEPLRIALAGLGTVGAGVIRLVEANAELIARRSGVVR